MVRHYNPLAARLFPGILVSLLLVLLCSVSLCQGIEAVGINNATFPEAFPTTITLRALVVHAPPFAIAEKHPLTEVTTFRGLQAELLQAIKGFALKDNVTLMYELDQSPPQYGAALDYVASDCNTLPNNITDEECSKYDMIVGDFWPRVERWSRVDFSPSWLRTTLTSMKYLNKPPEQPDFTTFGQVIMANASACTIENSALPGTILERFPKINLWLCKDQQQCILDLKAGRCALYTDDELQLRYYGASDVSIELTKEQFNTQYIVWPLRRDLDPTKSFYLKKWLYEAVTTSIMDELFVKYFDVELCPIGSAGKDCNEPCDPNHGVSDRQHNCVCESTRWTGPDCSIEVQPDLNLIPSALKAVGLSLFGINVATVIICFVWLHFKRASLVVRAAQPFFLAMVLLGCLISSSTIIVLGMEDSGNGPVPACMAMPWLYSVGFCVTFGTLYAKIRRVLVLFRSAAEMRKRIVTVQETLMVIGCILLIDLTILTVWTIHDPLQWERHTIAADKFGYSLASEGYCTSDHWRIYGGLIAALHLGLLAFASYCCYVSRFISTLFSEGKYLALAMISNMQIYSVALPVLIIVGADSDTSYFIRTVAIWMNDFMVVAIVFSHIMYVEYTMQRKGLNFQTTIQKALNRFSQTHRASLNTDQLESTIRGSKGSCKHRHDLLSESSESGPGVIVALNKPIDVVETATIPKSSWPTNRMATIESSLDRARSEEDIMKDIIKRVVAENNSLIESKQRDWALEQSLPDYLTSPTLRMHKSI